MALCLPPSRGVRSSVLYRSLWAAVSLGFVVTVTASSGMGAYVHEYRFCHDGILGSSLDLTVVTGSRDQAEACETAVLSEIERLRRLLSTYDPSSEISRLNATMEEQEVSPELFEVLSLYELWSARSGGVFNARVGSMLQAWKKGEAEQRIPDPDTLRKLCQGMEGPAVALDRERRRARRLTPHQLNVNAIGKNYIIERAVSAAYRADPGLPGLLLSIGGDIVCRGSALGPPGTPWRVGVVDPRCSFDNARPLAQLWVRDRAIATSGSYERHFRIGSQRYSYLVDPRTGWPVRSILGATVTAQDAMTADALSTTLCLLSPVEGLELVGQVTGAECLITSADGQTHASPGWRAFEAPALPIEIRQQKNSSWPDKFQVSIELSLAVSPPTTAGKPYRRPYVAVWAEDASGKPIRTIAEWGNNAKHQPELSAWWMFAGKDAALVKAVSKATRDAGKYTLLWDGLDDKGNAVPQGGYVIRVEVSREFGRHFKDMTAPLACKTKPALAQMKGNVEVDSVQIKFGPVP
jgi:thiamine biosynthesis lipoprotein